MGSKFSLTPWLLILVSRGVDYIDWPHTKIHIDWIYSCHGAITKQSQGYIKLRLLKYLIQDLEKYWPSFDSFTLVCLCLILAWFNQQGFFEKTKIKCLCIYWPLGL